MKKEQQTLLGRIAKPSTIKQSVITTSINTLQVSIVLRTPYKKEMAPHSQWQYYFDGEVVPVSIQPHGNKKHDNEPYERTKASVISSMKDKLQEMPPKMVINAMCKEVGGALNVQCSDDEPRNRSQLYKLNRTVEGKSGRLGAQKVTDFNNIMKMSTQGTFVHDFELKGGNPHCFLANQ